jgi:hypothetical protein
MSRYSLGFLACVFLITSASAGDKAPKEKAPPEATVFVDCNAGERINDALATSALNLTIEIDGICAEDVEIKRNNVTLRGDDPAEDTIRPDPDGLMRTAIALRNVSAISIENLTLTGAFNGIGINDSFSVNVTNCRLENNEFSGAIVGTASGSVNFADTVVSASTPAADARLRLGIWVTNGSNARCFNCVINDYRESIKATVGSQLFVSGGSFVGTRGALDVFDNSSVYLENAVIDGRVRVETKSIARLRDTSQSNTTLPNRSRNASSLVLEGTTSLIGDAWVGEFANMSLLNDSSMSGNLSCFNGGDAYCADPVLQTGSASCGQCATPPLP